MRPLVWALLALALLAVPASAQGTPELRVERGDGTITTVAVALDRGYAAVPLSLLDDLGWSVVEQGNQVALSIADDMEIDLDVGSPFFRWDGLVLQLANAPYRDTSGVFVPLQLLADFFPRRLPDLYEFDGNDLLLRAGSAEAGDDQAAADASAEPDLMPAPDYEGVRVVVIDPGHGGADPGALGVGGIREKDVALGIALELAEVLRNEPGLEVHLTRDDDTFVELWDRGQIATNIKGERPGVFISIHGNSFPDQRRTRGFETYWLSEARTEHERRVAANENAPLRLERPSGDAEDGPDLDFILRDLRNSDTGHWSDLLAQMTQEELDSFHPGPNRGVKQGVLAVLTNALMPSVLVEVGYLSNSDESRLMGQTDFQAQAAEAIGRSVIRFFERYPPGSGADQ